MTGINQGTPESAIGEPIRLGSNNEFEIEQHPISDRLIIRDTVNGKVAYVRKERGGQIGGDGVLIKALKEGKPMADDGRTYDTIQQAERAASSWVFVPPGTFNESVSIDTKALTLRGSGYSSNISGSSSKAPILVNATDVTIESLRITGGDVNSDGVSFNAGGGGVTNCTIDGTCRYAINCFAEHVIRNNSIVGADQIGVFENYNQQTIIVGNKIDGSGQTLINNAGIYVRDGGSQPWGCVVANNVITDSGGDGIRGELNDTIIIGNRVINATGDGIFTFPAGENAMIANNRVSDSGTADIDSQGTGTLLDANLTGASN